MNGERADPVRDRSAISRRLRRLEPPDAEQGLVRVLWHDLGRQFSGGRALRRLHRRCRRRGDRGGRRLVLLARLASPGDAGGLLGKSRCLRAPADHLGEGPGRPDPVALPVEARALLHGLAPPEPPAEGGGADAALDVGDAVLRQGRAARPPDAETARRLRDPDAPACGAGRALLRAVLGLRLADHGGRGQRPARLRDGDQPGLCRCRRRALAGRYGA